MGDRKIMSVSVQVFFSEPVSFWRDGDRICAYSPRFDIAIRAGTLGEARDAMSAELGKQATEILEEYEAETPDLIDLP